METIYAVDMNNGLSKEGKIPWKCKKDMLFFMNKTKYNIVIMGKNTFFSLPKQHRPLKNRLNIVLTSNPSMYTVMNEKEQSNILFTNNTNIYEDILQNREKYAKLYDYLSNDFKIFIIGGKMIYEHFIPLCDKIWVTNIKGYYNCDLFMEYDYSQKFSVKILHEDEEVKILEYTKTEPIFS